MWCGRGLQWPAVLVIQLNALRWFMFIDQTTYRWMCRTWTGLRLALAAPWSRCIVIAQRQPSSTAVGYSSLFSDAVADETRALRHANSAKAKM